MVAEGYDDCETDIIDRVRQIVGPDAKIGVELDLHCDVTQAMIDTADAIVLYKSILIPTSSIEPLTFST